MSDANKPPPAAGNAAAASSAPNASNGAASGAPSGAAPKKPLPEGNPAFRMMGLPRLRLPSRNWLIFLSITGSFASAVIYDKWQTKRIKQKWCDLVSHVAEEHLDTKNLPRRLTIYLSAPPADGLRQAREHFHNYVKPILVAGAMDWDVVEGRKEGDVRYKTSERIRRKRKRGGEGEAVQQEEYGKEYPVEMMREKTGTTEYPGVGGDIVIGRNTWKEYVRGLHEGWLGPADAPKQPEPEAESVPEPAQHTLGQPSLGDAAVKGAAKVVAANAPSTSTVESEAPAANDQAPEAQLEEEKPKEEEKKEEEKPKPRNPPPYILPSEYANAHLSPNTSELIGPSTAIQFPHLLGIRNTPIRIYRFLTRRNLADSIGRDVASAVLASYHRPYATASLTDENSASGDSEEAPEQMGVLAHEERNWWKTVREPRKEHEESVWIENMVLDERIASRMRKFELTSEDEERAKGIGEGKEVVTKRDMVEGVES